MGNLEVWKDVVGYEGLYQVSDLGRVKSLRFNKEKIMKQSISNGYAIFNLSIDGKSKIKKSSRIVWESFNGETNLDIDHINNNKLDNRLCNLQAITTRENVIKHYLIQNTSSKYVGVSWVKRINRWRSYIWFNGKLMQLGLFTDEYEANLAYQKALSKINNGIF